MRVFDHPNDRLDRGTAFLARIPDLLRSELDDGTSFDDTYLDAATLLRRVCLSRRD
jgi:hypothetical protein